MITAKIMAKPGKYAGFEHDGKIKQNRKEKHFYNEYAVLVSYKDAGHVANYNGYNIMRNIITARIYVTSGGTFYACVWINSATRKNRMSISLSGGGKAGGYGYHKASAALEHALNDAKIRLSESIGGRGEGAMFEALSAVAKAMGYKKFHIHNAHA